MDDKSVSKAPPAQRLYGEIVYWVTILASLLCMVGPVVAMAAKDKNVLDPHFLFANIFDGKSPEGVWALSANEKVRLDAWTKTGAREEHPGLLPLEATAKLASLPEPGAGATDWPEFGIGEELRIARLPGSEVTEEGKSYRRLTGKVRDLTLSDAENAVYGVYSKEVFHGGHFWKDHLSAGDGLTQFGLALGCSVALWALLAAAFAYMRQRVWLYVALALWVSGLVFLSAAGLIESH